MLGTELEDRENPALCEHLRPRQLQLLSSVQKQLGQALWLGSNSKQWITHSYRGRAWLRPVAPFSFKGSLGILFEACLLQNKEEKGRRRGANSEGSLDHDTHILEVS